MEDGRFRLLVDSLPELIWMSGKDKRCLYFNQQWLTFTGRSLQQELGNGWMEGVHRSDYERRASIYASAFDNGEAFTIEYRLRRFDGEYRWVLDTGRPWYSSDRKFAGYVGSAIDITERKQAEQAVRESEERFRQLAENIDQVFWFMEASPQRVLYVSPAFERFWGISAQALYNNPELWIHAVHTEDRARVERLFLSWVAGERDAFDVEYRVQGHDGLVRWIHDRGTKIYDDAGELVRLSGIAENITARKQAAEDREQLQIQVQQSQKMEAIGRLTGGIAHDFNNILASILGYTGLALRRFVTDKEGKLAEYLQEVYRAGERAQDLVTQMLAFGRDTDGESKPRKLGSLVDETIKMLQSSLPSGIELSAPLEDDTPAVMIDSVHLYQLMINLCINACDAMAGRGRIHIYLRHLQGVNTLCSSCHRQVQGEFVELTVKDTGIGMGPDVMGRMFDPFFSGKTPVKGTGMGLSVVHGIVHDRNGHIVVESTQNVGSAFRLLFPVVKNEKDSKNSKRSKRKKGVGGKG